MCDCSYSKHYLRRVRERYLGQTTDYDPNDIDLMLKRRRSGHLAFWGMLAVYSLVILAAWIIPALVSVGRLP